MYRGKSLGHEYVIMVATANQWKVWVDSGPTYWLPPELQADTIESADAVAEQRVQWPAGVGHCDLYIRETRTIVEVLSSAHASEEMRRSKLLQAVLYVEHHPDAENAALIVLNPSDFTEERTVLVPTSRLYTNLVEEMHVRIQTVIEWEHEGTIPARVCAKPSEARSHFCRHAEYCFTGWEAPPLEQIASSEELLTATATFEETKRARSELASQDKVLERTQKDAQAVMEAAGLPAKHPVQVGPYRVTRTAVQRQPTFDWSRAESAGVFEPGLYGEFFKPGASYSTFQAERVDHSGSEYGEEAPW